MLWVFRDTANQQSRINPGKKIRGLPQTLQVFNVRETEKLGFGEVG